MKIATFIIAILNCIALVAAALSPADVLNQLQEINDKANEIRQLANRITLLNAITEATKLNAALEALNEQLDTFIEFLEDQAEDAFSDPDAQRVVARLQMTVQAVRAALTTVNGKFTVLIVAPVRRSLRAAQTQFEEYGTKLVAFVPTQAAAAREQFATLVAAIVAALAIFA